MTGLEIGLQVTATGAAAYLLKHYIARIHSSLDDKALALLKSKRVRTFARRLANRFSAIAAENRSIVIVGEGELAVEMGISFRRIGCRVIFVTSDGRHAVDFVLGDSENHFKRYQEVSISKETWSISKVADYSFSTLHGPLWNIIEKNRPAAVVLEDFFISKQHWELVELGPARGGDLYRPPFFPSSSVRDGASAASSDLLSRRETRKFLEGTAGVQLVECLRLSGKTPSRSFGRFVAKHVSGVFVKPDTTSSGHGMSYITEESRIQSALAAMTEKYRVRSKGFLVEEALDLKAVEAMVVVLTHPNGVMRTVGPIEYKRAVRTETYIGGPFRLAYSRFPASSINKRIRGELCDTAKKIAREFRSPFLAVEFILADRGAVVNEVSWRPDDIGMVTVLSHHASQFDLFANALLGKEWELEDANSYAESCVCKPIVLAESWWKHPSLAPHSFDSSTAVRLYQKEFLAPHSGVEKVMGFYVTKGKEPKRVEDELSAETQDFRSPGPLVFY